MSFTKVILIPSDEEYKKRFGDKQWHIPGGSIYFDDICHADDGSPVVVRKDAPIIMKIGKRQFLKIVVEDKASK